jgi:triacylglycerol lipase
MTLNAADTSLASPGRTAMTASCRRQDLDRAQHLRAAELVDSVARFEALLADSGVGWMSADPRDFFMSFLVELPFDQYQPHAFAPFTSTRGFNLGTAKAMAWMSQLAYETPHPKKIEDVLHTWDLAPVKRLASPVTSVLPMTSTRGVIATHPAATIVAFAGTDVLSLGNWITDLDAGLTIDDVHGGFETAVDTVWADVEGAIKEAKPAGRALFITGHSMGGALAIVTAERAHRQLKAEVTGIYTFGGMRPGGETFAKLYPLGEVTYRLIHGDDLPSALPPLAMGFRHVGRMLYCPRGGSFKTSVFSPLGEDTRAFDRTFLDGLRDTLRSRIWTPASFVLRADLLGRIFRLLPPPIGDHIPDRYTRALDRID